MRSSTQPVPADRLRPLREVLLVGGVSLAAFAAELAVSAHLPWGDAGRGAVAVLAGAAVAVRLTRTGGGSLADLGLRRPDRWLTVPLWAVGILGVFVLVQALVPTLLAAFLELPAPRG